MPVNSILEIPEGWYARLVTVARASFMEGRGMKAKPALNMIRALPDTTGPNCWLSRKPNRRNGSTRTQYHVRGVMRQYKSGVGAIKCYVSNLSQKLSSRHGMLTKFPRQVQYAILLGKSERPRELMANRRTWLIIIRREHEGGRPVRKPTWSSFAKDQWRELSGHPIRKQGFSSRPGNFW